MIIFTILVSVVFVLGALTIYAFGAYTETRGYMRGLEEAAQIMEEVQNGNSSKDL